MSLFLVRFLICLILSAYICQAEEDLTEVNEPRLRISKATMKELHEEAEFYECEKSQVLRSYLSDDWESGDYCRNTLPKDDTTDRLQKLLVAAKSMVYEGDLKAYDDALHCGLDETCKHKIFLNDKAKLIKIKSKWMKEIKQIVKEGLKKTRKFMKFCLDQNW